MWLVTKEGEAERKRASSTLVTFTLDIAYTRANNGRQNEVSIFEAPIKNYACVNILDNVDK